MRSPVDPVRELVEAATQVLTFFPPYAPTHPFYWDKRDEKLDVLRAAIKAVEERHRWKSSPPEPADTYHTED